MSMMGGFWACVSVVRFEQKYGWFLVVRERERERRWQREARQRIKVAKLGARPKEIPPPKASSTAGPPDLGGPRSSKKGAVGEIAYKQQKYLYLK